MKAKKLTIGERVEVKWLDAASTDGWFDSNDHEPLTPANCQTVGYVQAITKQYITLAQSLADESYNGTITIPSPWTCKITRLRDA